MRFRTALCLSHKTLKTLVKEYDMKTTTKTRNVRASGGLQSNLFSIAATAESFKILSSGMYSDGVKAIVRELCTNAYDSHVEAGRASTPFEVYLPNYNAPVFRVRDYGVSIAHDDMPAVYCTYFNSTKTSDNVQQGKFGLGSKAFFAYAESASVTTYIDGVARAYVAMLNADGVPDLKFLGESPSDEPTGMDIRIAVNPHDAKLFERAAVAVLPHFPVTPRIHGVFVDNFLPRRSAYEIPNLKEDSWELLKKGFVNTHCAVMGYVAYPLDREHLTVENAEWLYSIEYSTTLVLHCEIGDFDIPPSRESITYTEETIQLLNEKVGHVRKVYLQRFVDRIDAATNFNEACLVYEKIQNELPYTLSAGLGKWRGRTLVSHYSAYNFPETVCLYQARERAEGRWESRRVTQLTSLSIREWAARKDVIVVDPETPIATVRQYMRHLSAQEGQTIERYIITHSPKIQQRSSAFLDYLDTNTDGWVFFEDLTMPPPPPKRQRLPSSKKPGKPGPSRALIAQTKWDLRGAFFCAVDVDWEAGGYWIPIDRRKVDAHAISDLDETEGHYTTSKDAFCSHYKAYAHACEILGKEPVPVIGVRRAHWQKYAEEDGWSLPFKVMHDTLVQALLSPKFAQLVDNTVLDKAVTGGYYSSARIEKPLVPILCKFSSQMDVNHLLLERLKEAILANDVLDYDDYGNTHSTMSHTAAHLAQVMGLPALPSACHYFRRNHVHLLEDIRTDIQEARQAFADHFPLLKFVFESSLEMTNYTGDIEEYLQQCLQTQTA